MKRKSAPKTPKTPRRAVKAFERPFLEKEMRMIHEVSGMMRQGLTYTEALKTVLKCVAGALKAERVEIHLYDPRDRTLAREMSLDSRGRYVSGASVKIQLAEKYEDPFSRLVFGRSPYISQMPKAKKGKRTEGGLNVKVPIRAAGKVLGILTVDYPRKDRPRKRPELLGLLAFATQVGFILENMRLHFEIVQLAFKDDLTGQYNHRFWVKRLGEETERSNRYKHPFAILLLGLDRFSAFNETYGYSMGDRMLRDLGHWLRRILRTCDLVARLGGDQYSVLLPETNLEGARTAAEKIRAGVEAFEFVSDPALKEVGSGFTVSIGSAEYPTHGPLPEQFMERTRQALQKAKEAGGNRHEAAQPVNGNDSLPAPAAPTPSP